MEDDYTNIETGLYKFGSVYRHQQEIRFINMPQQLVFDRDIEPLRRRVLYSDKSC